VDEVATISGTSVRTQAIFVGDRSADPFDNEMDRAELAGCYRAALSALHPPKVSDLPRA
jgi:hypothetical protein